jgi:hypothetical protein
VSFDGSGWRLAELTSGFSFSAWSRESPIKPLPQISPAAAVRTKATNANRERPDNSANDFTSIGSQRQATISTDDVALKKTSRGLTCRS